MNLIKLIQKTASNRHPYNVFSDFVEMSALAISNSCDKRFYDERETKYLELINRYEKNEQQNFPAMLAELTAEMEKNPGDILGEIYLDVYSEWKTPFHILFNWDYKLNRARKNSNGFPVLSPAPCKESSNREILGNLMPAPQQEIEQGQMALFL